LPYVPLLLIAFAGLVLPGTQATRLRLALPAVLAYYVTVASADNWSGAVCNLGRYAMPVVPWLLALLALVLARTSQRPGVIALALMLAGWSALIGRHLWLDPEAANDCAVLLAKADLADGNAYLPNLFIRAWVDGAPGLAARIAAWIGLIATAALWLRRAALGRAGQSPGRVLAGVMAVVLAAGLLLERWPGTRAAPRFGDALDLGGGATAFFSGPVVVEDGAAVSTAGRVTLLVRARAPLTSVRLLAGGEGELRLPGAPPLSLGGRAREFELPLEPLARLVGRRGVEETLARQALDVRTRGEVRLRPAPPGLLPP
jgi:hypothetical protein